MARIPYPHERSAARVSGGLYHSLTAGGDVDVYVDENPSGPAAANTLADVRRIDGSSGDLTLDATGAIIDEWLSPTTGPLSLIVRVDGGPPTRVFPRLDQLAASGHTHSYQPLDADLTAIAALAPADGAVVQRAGGVWSAPTPTQLVTSLRTGSGRVGVSLPDGWDAGWRTALAGSGSSPAVALVQGDSLPYGYYADNPRSHSVVGLLRIALQTAYGDGGSGFHGALENSLVLGHGNLYDGVPGGYATLGGDWFGRVDDGPYGPGGRGLMGTAAAGATITFEDVAGSTVRVYAVTGSGSTETVDGGSPVALTTSPAAVGVTTVTGLSAGEHTVTVTASPDGIGLYGVRGETAAGVRVDNMSIPGEQLLMWAEHPETTSWAGGADWPCDLFILAVGGNDFAAATPAGAAQQGGTKILARVREANPDASILVVTPPVGLAETDDPDGLWTSYAEMGRALADTFGGAHVSLWALARNNRSSWVDAGYAGSSSPPAGSVGDDLHPSTAGHQQIADWLLPVLTGG